MVKLSIIIPYFETYELTYKLLKKLAKQKTNEVEIILIDDYCKDEFKSDEELDGKITIVHHIENEGVAKSRNEGIEIAEGKYIAFIDCDDIITDDYISTLIKAIDEYDADVINFNWADLHTKIEYHKPNNCAPWKAIYKKETMPKFMETYEYGHEDVPFQEEIMSGKYSIIYLDKLLYYYNSNREGSLIWKKTHRKEVCNMIKVKALERFILNDFDKIENLVRADINKKERGRLYPGDIFECDKKMVDYLTKTNRFTLENPSRKFIEVIEVIPDKKEEKTEVFEKKSQKTEKTRRRRKII